MGAKVSFIGLGSMGTPMATNLIKNGAQVSVYNRSKEKAEPLVKAGAKLLESPKEVFKHSDVVISMVANDKALLDIADGTNGILANARKGCIHVSCSTVAAATTEKLAKEHKEKGVTLLAAPVFGRPDVAAKQALWICVAGEDDAKKQAEPFLKMMGQKIYDFGPNPEAANHVKATGNFMILNVIEAFAEAFSVLKGNGVSAEAFYNMITDSLFPSPVYRTYGKLVLDEKFMPPGFTVTLGLKDIELFLKSAAAAKAKPPFATVLRERLQKNIEKGRADMDWSSIALLLKE